jgi:hypothetical protein
MIAGMTDYSHQTFDDMFLDLQVWIKNLEEVTTIISKNIRKLKELEYWKKVDSDFQGIVQYSLKFYDTSIKEISEILSEIQQEVKVHHVKRIRNLYKTATDLDIRYGEIWHNRYEDKDYDNKNFRLVEELYEQGRGMAIDMRDLSNLAGRLEDFVGRKGKIKTKIGDNVDMLELKPNFFGLGINLNEVIRKFIRRKR